MHGIQYYIGWTHIPNMDSVVEDSLFAAPKQQPVGKISLQMTVVPEMDNLNLTLVQGYQSSV